MLFSEINFWPITEPNYCILLIITNVQFYYFYEAKVIIPS